MNGPGPEHDPDDLSTFQEHGQTWQACRTCGAQWDAHGEEVSEGGWLVFGECQVIWHVVVADVFWLMVAMALTDAARLGWFGWKRRDRMVWWLKALCCYIVVELFLHKQLEWLASIVMAALSRWEE